MNSELLALRFSAQNGCRSLLDFDYGQRMKSLVFVYGSLKRGRSNHAWLAGQSFIGTATTRPVYRLFNLGTYPGMIESPVAGQGIRGEVWEVDSEGLAKLDVLEGIEEGEYARVLARLAAPFDAAVVQTYVYLKSIEGMAEVIGEW
jgi:gamma-glutamylaminecyclotransferase